MYNNKVIFIIFFIVIHSLVVYSVHFNGKTFYNNNEIKIFDISHKYLSNLSNNDFAIYLNDIIAISAPFLFGREVFFEFIEYYPVILIIRCLMNYVTILPKNKHCKDDEFGIKNLIKGHCYDKIFSGHFTITLLVALIVYNNKIITNKLPILLYLLFHIILILATRSHYTIDVIVAFFVVTWVYNLGLKINL